MSVSFRTLFSGSRILLRAFASAEYSSSAITVLRPSFPPFICTITRTRSVSVADATRASSTGERPYALNVNPPMNSGRTDTGTALLMKSLLFIPASSYVNWYSGMSIMNLIRAFSFVFTAFSFAGFVGSIL